MAICKIGHRLSELFCAVTAFGRSCASMYAPEEPSTLLVDADALY